MQAKKCTNKENPCISYFSHIDVIPDCVPGKKLLE